MSRYRRLWPEQENAPGWPEGDPATATCKHCGEGGLEWVNTGVRSRLVDGRGRFHVCKQFDAADDFEKLA